MVVRRRRAAATIRPMASGGTGTHLHRLGLRCSLPVATGEPVDLRRGTVTRRLARHRASTVTNVWKTSTRHQMGPLIGSATVGAGSN